MGIGPDFLLVQFTAAGLAFAKGGAMRISNGRISVLFMPSAPTKIARFEWDMLLKDHTTADGSVLFEIVPPTAPVMPAAPVEPAPAAAGAPAAGTKESQ